MKGYSTLQTRLSEACLPVQSDLADAEAAHIQAFHHRTDTSQAEPRTLPARPTVQEDSSLPTSFSLLRPSC